MSIKTLGSTGGVLPTENAALAELLGLQPVAIFEPDELKTAFRANAFRCDQLNAPAIISGLTDFWRRKRGFGPESARTFVWNRHPRLFAEMRRKSSGTTSANAVVREHVRRGPGGQPMRIRAFYRADRHGTTASPTAPAPKAATRDEREREHEKWMLHHDEARFAAKDPETFKAHSSSLEAWSLSDKASEHGGRFHHEAQLAHEHAADLQEEIRNTEAVQRHAQQALHHERQHRMQKISAPVAANEAANEVCWIA